MAQLGRSMRAMVPAVRKGVRERVAMTRKGDIAKKFIQKQEKLLEVARNMRDSKKISVDEFGKVRSRINKAMDAAKKELAEANKFKEGFRERQTKRYEKAVEGSSQTGRAARRAKERYEKKEAKKAAKRKNRGSLIERYGDTESVVRRERQRYKDSIKEYERTSKPQRGP